MKTKQRSITARKTARKAKAMKRPVKKAIRSRMKSSPLSGHTTRLADRPPSVRADLNVRCTREQHEFVKKAANSMNPPETMNWFVLRAALARVDEVLGTSLAGGMRQAGPIAVPKAG